MFGNGWNNISSEYNGLINKDDIVIRNVRLQSAAGWYVGAVEFYNFEEMDFYSRDSCYYPTESMLASDYPESISVEEAFNKIKFDRLYKSRMNKKLGIR